MSVVEKLSTTAGRSIALSDEHLEEFRTSFRGEVLGREDAGYDDARRLWNGMIDKHPALIARCTGTADVVAAVKFARAHELLVAVKGCGHNVAGNALVDDGLVIDLSQMNAVRVDADAKTAHVQPGADWGDIDHETQHYGLVTPGGQVSTTGVAGFTLGGGMGNVRRKWGLASDNLLSVEIVTADGEVRTASHDEHPDLFWAVRGGGGNFGVATSFEFQLHELGPEIYGAVTIYPLDEAVDVIRNWRDYVVDSPDEVTCDLLLWGMPPFPEVPPEQHWAPVIIVTAMYAGPVDEGEAVLARARELGTPLADLSGPQPYVQYQSDFDPLFPDGLQYYWKSLFANALDEAAIEGIARLAENRPSPQTMLMLRSLGGAMSRIPEDATAYANRAALFNLSIDATWGDPDENERIIGWTRNAWSKMRDLTGGGVYLNFAGLGEDNDDLVRAGYAGNQQRLTEIKRRYDPTNLFRGNINITPK